MVVFTFLEAYIFSGKTVVSFCTHEGSGMGAVKAISESFAPRGRVLKGLAIRGGIRDCGLAQELG
jgi:hypothetical protein